LFGSTRDDVLHCGGGTPILAGEIIMSIDLIEDVFEPVLISVKSAISDLSKKTPPIYRERRGLESWFQREIVTPTLRDRGYEIKECGRGVDLLIRHANSELRLELKAANDFRINYVVGIEGDGWITKYMGREPLLAGCLFLGCESNEGVNARLIKLDKTLKNPQQGHNITLAKCQYKELATSDGHYYWVLGLLVTDYGHRYLARKDK
jgi:hypothetical protein